MAASVLLPLAASIIPGVAPVVEQLILQGIDKLFGNGTGKVKKQLATQTFQALGNALVSAGQAAPTQLPSAEQISANVDKAVADLNAAGALKGKDTQIAAPAPDTGINVKALHGGLTMLAGILEILETASGKT